MKVIIHQTQMTIADFDSMYNYIENELSNGAEGLHIFPESFLTGYPLQDLCLQKEFMSRYHALLERINTFSTSLKKNDEKIFFMGGLDYTFDTEGLPHSIKNVIFELKPGSKLNNIYAKILLPNYDIFDEKKYYNPGDEVKIYTKGSHHIALMICEDMWPSSTHDRNPIEELAKLANDTKSCIDLVINLSASPFHIWKHEKRIERGREIAEIFKAPFVYVNRVGGEDEVLFDGASFITTHEKMVHQCKTFMPDRVEIDLELPDDPYHAKVEKDFKTENTWESFFSPKVDLEFTPPVLQSWNEKQFQLALASLSFGLMEYAKKNGFTKYLVALSGGIDSALVLAILKLAIQDSSKIEAIYMPGLFSAGISYDLSFDMAKRIGITLKSMPIKFLHTTMRNSFRESYGEPLQSLADENIQSRIRGALLYGRSNTTGALVINTSNKSELAVGYSTLYGDSVGGISLLGDLYKTEVFALSRYINSKYGEIIPPGIIDRPPSAELRENQKDEDSLPAYSVLDPLLELILSYRLSKEEIIKLGFKKEIVERVLRLHQVSEYKRSQFCPILKLKPKSFGFGHRVPICKKLFL